MKSDVSPAAELGVTPYFFHNQYTWHLEDTHSLNDSQYRVCKSLRDLITDDK